LTDRNLLFGILAVQMDFVSRDALIAAMHSWVMAKHRPLGDLLQEQGALSPERRGLLDAMADEHLRAHGGDVQRSLAAVAHHSTLGDLAQSVADPDLQASLAAAGATLATTADVRPMEDGLRYQVLRPHAQGGLGLVSVARDAELGREVAFKEIQGRYAEDTTQRGRFVREAEITGGLEHPGIVPVYGLGRYTDGRPYYAMRLVRGESLQEAARKLHAGDAGYTLRGLVTRFVAVCNAVAYAHSRGVIHRDLKPANILLGPYGETLVVDWGLAKVIGREPADGAESGEATLRPPSGAGAETLAGAALGTPAFMSPEQARGETAGLGPATDVYSLGATLYAIVTGRPPVRGRDTAEMLEKVRLGDWPPPRQVLSSAPRALDAVCCKAMALKSGDRYGSALDLAADVEHWLADEPVSAWREPWPLRFARWRRRHRQLVASSAAAALVALLLGAVGLAWLQREEGRTRAAAEAALQRVDDLRATARWGEARAALQQAEEWLGRSSPAELRRRLDAARGDLTLVARLEELRQELASFQLNERTDETERTDLDQRSKLTPAGRGTHQSQAEMDHDYAAAFGEAGLGVPGTDPAAVAERVAASAVREQLVAALDDWSVVAVGERRDWALEVARRADPDPWRDRLRDPATRDNVASLTRVAMEAPPRDVTPSLAAAVCGRLPDIAACERLLQAARNIEPGDFWLNTYLGFVLQNTTGRSSEASGYFRAALAVRPDDSVAHINFGLALFQEARREGARRVRVDERVPSPAFSRARLESAEAEFRRAIDLDPGSPRAVVSLGSVLRARGKEEEARATIQRAIELASRSARTCVRTAASIAYTAALCQETAVQEALYRKALELEPGNAKAHVGLAGLLPSRGQPQQAESLYRKAIELNPEAGEAYYRLGFLLQEYVPEGTVTTRLDEIAALYRKAIEFSPHWFAPYFKLGDVELARGRLDEAADLYRKAIEVGPWYAPAHIWLGSVLELQGRHEEAAKLYSKAGELDPGDAGSWFERGKMFRSLGRPQQAEALYRKAIELDPDNASVRFRLGQVRWSQGRLPEAEEHLRKAAELEPEVGVYLAALGGVLLLQGKNVEAEAVLRKTIALHPDYPVAYANLGAALVGQGKINEATAACRKAIELAPGEVEAHCNLADALIRRGKPEEAADHCRKALELNPNSDVAHCNLAEAMLGLGRYAEAGEAARRALAAPTTPGASGSSEVEDALRQASLGKRLPAVLRGDDHPTAAEGIDFAGLCRYQWRLAAAARLYAGVFTADPKLADDLRSGHRFDAARAAALAGCGTGTDAPGPEDEERARLRGQARAWLRADLSRHSRELAGGPGEKAAATERLRRWLTDEDLAGTRDAAALATLPQAERKEWEAFWAEVKAVLANPPAK
jgi:tetratricopeptide (TPR) repeat protein